MILQVSASGQKSESYALPAPVVSRTARKRGGLPAELASDTGKNRSRARPACFSQRIRQMAACQRARIVFFLLCSLSRFRPISNQSGDRRRHRRIPGRCRGELGMRTEQFRWSQLAGWEPQAPPGLLGVSAQLALVFVGPGLIGDRSWYHEVRQAYPGAHIFGCSTSGQIYGGAVREDSVVVTAIAFEHTRVEVAHSHIPDSAGGYEVGHELASMLDAGGLRHAFLICDATNTNANDSVSGVVSALPPGTHLFGGCPSNGHDMGNTYVVCDCLPEPKMAAVVGFYGDRLKVGVGSSAGWDQLGLERLITKSKQNVLYEFDGRPALPLYKKYLGSVAAGLPESGMLFPVRLRFGDCSDGVLRGVLAVNEQEQSITFLGNVPEGAHARIMFGSAEHLIDGSITAAQQTLEAIGALEPELLIVVSCVARQLVLKERTAEELECFEEVFGNRPTLAGFYALGEIAPIERGGRADFHNETLTAVALAES